MSRADHALPQRQYAVASALVLSVLVASVAPRPAWAVYLDGNRNFSVRARLYTEASVATEDSEPQTATEIETGDVVSHRTFFNPEFDGNLTHHLSFLGLDEIKFRFALWGFYDGIYDYLDRKWARTAKNFKARISKGSTSSAPFFFRRTDTPIFDRNNPPRKVYTYQADPTLGDDGGPGDIAQVPFRINEAYVNLTKGRVSLRIGRQAISWGESDTIALLDQTNPFDQTRAIPGLLTDIDEARIPLWTLRTQVRLFGNWKCFSSPFLDAYLVPGSIDTTVGSTPIPGGVSPYSPPESDPQGIIDDLVGSLPPGVDTLLVDTLGGLSFTQYQREPSRNMANSRWGIRLESVINRDYTASVWFYRTFSSIPVPHFKRLDLSHTSVADPVRFPVGDPRNGPTQLITETARGLTNVIGTSLSFYNQFLNGIVRLNAQYFEGEPAFIPSKNIPFQALLRNPTLLNNPALGPIFEAAGIKRGPFQGFVPRADYLRWEVGYDRFFFNRVLNPANSFVWVTAFVGSWNVDETFSDRDYRYYGQRKATGDSAAPWKLGANFEVLGSLADLGKLKTVDTDYVDLHQVEWFVQSSLQTDYFNGRMTPRLVGIANGRGTYVVAPSIVFRYSDRVLLTVKYTAMMGGFFQTGFFRDRDQFSTRLTFLLN